MQYKLADAGFRAGLGEGELASTEPVLAAIRRQVSEYLR